MEPCWLLEVEGECAGEDCSVAVLLSFSLPCISFFRAFVTVRNYPVYLSAPLPIYFLLQSERTDSQPLELDHKDFPLEMLLE